MECSIAAWSQWEKGKRDPGLESIPAICKMFGITANELFGGTSAATARGDGAIAAAGSNIHTEVGKSACKSVEPGEMAACRKCQCKRLYDAVQKAQKSLPK